MKRIALPKQDFTLSQYAAGFWRLRDWGLSSSELHTFVSTLIDRGVTTMDHAMVYRSEPIFGELLASDPALRAKIEIVSKCGIKPPGFGVLGAKETAHYDSSPEAIIDSVEHSLRALKTEFLDVLLIHRPDYLMDVDATADVFKKLKTDGKVKAFGVSNFTVAQFSALNAACDGGLVTNQVEFSVFESRLLDDGVFEQCQSTGISPMFWSCLGGGRVAQPNTPSEIALLQKVQVLASKYNAKSPEAILYAWVSNLPCKPIVLFGSSKLERLLLALEDQDLVLETEDWYALLEIARGEPIP